MPKPIYAKLRSTRYSTRHAPLIVRNLAGRAAALSRPRLRGAARDRSRPDWAIYADAAFDETPGGGAAMEALFFRTVSPNAVDGA